MEERRATSRYSLALPVEIRIAPDLTADNLVLVKTRNISTRGFYFTIAREFKAGTEFEFSIALPIEITGATQAYINGKARAVRVEEAGEGQPSRLGVGAVIESYEVKRSESMKP